MRASPSGSRLALLGERPGIARLPAWNRVAPGILPPSMRPPPSDDDEHDHHSGPRRDAQRRPLPLLLGRLLRGAGEGPGGAAGGRPRRRFAGAAGMGPAREPRRARGSLGGGAGPARRGAGGADGERPRRRGVGRRGGGEAPGPARGQLHVQPDGAGRGRPPRPGVRRARAALRLPLSRHAPLRARRPAGLRGVRGGGRARPGGLRPLRGPLGRRPPQARPAVAVRRAAGQPARPRAGGGGVPVRAGGRSPLRGRSVSRDADGGRPLSQRPRRHVELERLGEVPGAAAHAGRRVPAGPSPSSAPSGFCSARTRPSSRGDGSGRSTRRNARWSTRSVRMHRTVRPSSAATSSGCSAPRDSPPGRAWRQARRLAAIGQLPAMRPRSISRS